ncbi:tRNA (adenosine(37)-N6)-threonylcarbamoyltransferase complex ATPase subunit type 1 TsaE [Phycisphaerales bacterium AB-hyl4]|uniref:tRNA threonylcarbamoyladenosine biosynthesis protein TsaE n=1 Tax=Natronomicrosphaera hydrolytica TaxID=3242702 RepID=A0ABV4U471_9BACT
MTVALQVESQTLEQTLAVGTIVARRAVAGDIVGLSGELGAGKTQFVRGMAEGMGLDPRVVSSPTFVLVHEYEREAADVPPDALVLVHIDAYRLAGDDAAAGLESIGWADELFEQAVVAVEWADVLGEHLGDDWLAVRLEHSDPGRLITLSAHGRWLPRIELLQADLIRAGLCPQPVT